MASSASRAARSASAGRLPPRRVRRRPQGARPRQNRARSSDCGAETQFARRLVEFSCSTAASSRRGSKEPISDCARSRPVSQDVARLTDGGRRIVRVCVATISAWRCARASANAVRSCAGLSRAVSNASQVRASQRARPAPPRLWPDWRGLRRGSPSGAARLPRVPKAALRLVPSCACPAAAFACLLDGTQSVACACRTLASASAFARRSAWPLGFGFDFVSRLARDLGLRREIAKPVLLSQAPGRRRRRFGRKHKPSQRQRSPSVETSR